MLGCCIIELVCCITFPLKHKLLDSNSRRDYVLLSSNERLDKDKSSFGHDTEYELLDSVRSRQVSAIPDKGGFKAHVYILVVGIAPGSRHLHS